MLCAYHTVNEKQGGKSKVRLVRGKKKKKKSFQFQKNRGRHRTEAPWNPAQEENQMLKGKKKKREGSRKVNIHTNNSKKQVCMTVGFLLRRTN